MVSNLIVCTTLSIEEDSALFIMSMFSSLPHLCTASLGSPHVPGLTLHHRTTSLLMFLKISIHYNIIDIILISLIHSLLGSKKITVLPEYTINDW